MPVTRATIRASRGAAQAPSTIYSTYNEIVSIIQGGLPPRRARRVPKRAREESEPTVEEQMYQIFGTPEEIPETSTTLSTSTSTSIIPEEFRGISVTPEEFREIFGTPEEFRKLQDERQKGS